MAQPDPKKGSAWHSLTPKQLFDPSTELLACPAEVVAAPRARALPTAVPAQSSRAEMPLQLREGGSSLQPQGEGRGLQQGCSPQVTQPAPRATQQGPLLPWQGTGSGWLQLQHTLLPWEITHSS